MIICRLQRSNAKWKLEPCCFSSIWKNGTKSTRSEMVRRFKKKKKNNFTHSHVLRTELREAREWPEEGLGELHM